MKVTMTKCDAPDCKRIGQPELEKPYVPPYGWLQVKGHFIGCGPNISIEVCSINCLKSAVEEQVRLDRENKKISRNLLKGAYESL